MLCCNLRFRKQKAMQASSLVLLYFDVYSQGLLDNIKTKHMKTLVVKTNEVTFSNHTCMSTEECYS